jgi:4-amino-4-deoxy-L-arabinose transferase-like glycosyltransferase
MKFSTYFKDIRFWILFFFVIRLIGITNPPLEVAHNWRQTTVTMVARNFLEIDNNILYPRIDIAGEKTGITGMEFPTLNYLIYLVSELFGYQHWYGRLINLIISSIGLFYFYKLVKRYFTKTTSFYATIILTVSIWFQFSRKIMPDTFAMSFIFMAIYYGTNYLLSKNNPKNSVNLALYFIFVLIGMLSKLPAGYLLILFVFYLFQKEIALKRKLLFCILSILVLIPVYWWYFIWVPHLVDTYGFWHFFMGKSMQEGVSEILLNLKDTLKKFYDTAMKFSGFLFFLVGITYAFIRKERKIYLIFSATFLVFCVLILKSGFTFSHHSYYIIPFVPVMALVAGYGVNQIKNQRFRIFLLILICIEGLGNQFHDFMIHENDSKILNLEKDLDKFSTRNDLIVINSGEYPTPMYFAHRKGWVNSNDSINQEKYVNNLKNKGLKYIVILKRSFAQELVLPNYVRVFNNPDYSIYKP